MKWPSLKFFHGFEKHPLSQNSQRGAIAVEYAFGMLLAAFLMMGVELMFRQMAIDVITFFKQMVTQFPNI